MVMQIKLPKDLTRLSAWFKPLPIDYYTHILD